MSFDLRRWQLSPLWRVLDDDVGRFDDEYDAVEVELEVSDNVNNPYCVGLLGSEEKTAPVGKCTQSSESAKTGEKITDGEKTKDDNLNGDAKGEETKRRKKKEKKKTRKVEKREEEAKKREIKAEKRKEDAEKRKEEIEATDAPT